MITAVDTSIVLDILTASPIFLKKSKALYQQYLGRGRLVACPVVWSEIRPFFESDAAMLSVFGKMHLDFDPFDETSAMLAGIYWRDYRKKGGKQERVIADFLIAAHAQTRCSCLLTRDRGFYKKYFKDLGVVIVG